MSDKNKVTKEEFLKLSTEEQLNLVNPVLMSSGTDGIGKNFDFSYGWLGERFKEKNIFFASSVKRFIIEERAGTLTDNELAEIRALLNDYWEFKHGNIPDVRFCAGSCGKETVTKSIVIDKEINEMFNEFSKRIVL